MGVVTLLADDQVNVLGYLEPYRSIEMSPSETGMIDTISVSEGEIVKKGQALLNLNNRVLEAQLSISEVQSESMATIEVATADLEVAKERFEKLNQLKNSGTAHSSEVARAAADLRKAEAQLSIANEEKKIAGFRVEEIKGQIEQRILRSPIDGVVIEINREVAESATAPQEGQQNRPLVKVAQIDKLRLVVHVPSAHAGGLAVGGTLPIRVFGQSSLSLNRESNALDATAVIEFISPTIDPSSETLRIRLAIDNADGKLLSGAHALVIIKPLANS
ncbi:MAG: efflux RND transporter periplasmic adaptor subunit [Verrucomicrobiales bacterium]